MEYILVMKENGYEEYPFRDKFEYCGRTYSANELRRTEGIKLMMGRFCFTFRENRIFMNTGERLPFQKKMRISAFRVLKAVSSWKMKL